ncbi:MAG: Ribonuclease Y [Candidatus Peregrinibacteria bacterium GW2011_GWA2_47_7]|nr:MAG: Ribonuclease Y [Candidatus Peregrinibacteria bacterium GW2011_GWA2_47_7]
MTLQVILIFVGLLVGMGAGFFYRKFTVEKKNKEAIERTDRLIQDAESKAKEMVLEAKNEALSLKQEAQREERQKRDELQKINERLIQKEEVLDKKIEVAERTKGELEDRALAVKTLKEEVEQLYKMEQEQLEKVAALSRAEAKEILFKKIEEEARDEIIVSIRRAQEEEKKHAAVKAKAILAEAIQRYAADVAVESTSTTVALPSDEMKGRIIGKEGRNINAFEQITGVDVLVDDTPGSIVISGFDLVRRYIAKICLERLIVDGRIHPARIEETYEKVKQEVNELIKDLGEKAAYEAGVSGLPLNLIKLLGRLKFRVSYGQNVLKHSMEVSALAAMIAAELGANVEVCRKAGLLHDIGKAVDHEIAGHHSKIGRDILKKFGLSEEIIHAVEASDQHVEPHSIEAMVVEAANKIAISRPGATKENLDNYIKRMQELENVVNDFEGVKKAYVIQAGNAVRIFVDPSKVDDLAMVKLSNTICRKIETDFQYPGEIKVHVVREIRAEAFAE